MYTSKGKIYIAGKITGLSDFQERFKKAEEDLSRGGYTCLNPAILPKGFEQEEYLHVCFSMIDICDSLYMLDNWKDSPGACREHTYALQKNKNIIYQSNVSSTL